MYHPPGMQASTLPANKKYQEPKNKLTLLKIKKYSRNFMPISK
jgi:hypothetical protein